MILALDLTVENTLRTSFYLYVCGQRRVADERDSSEDRSPGVPGLGKTFTKTFKSSKPCTLGVKSQGVILVIN